MVTILLIALSLTPDDHGKLPLFLDVLRKVLIITIAAIPLGLPTVMSVTMAMGSKELAAKQVIVKRLPAIEELASVSILCSDKTGTLTLNSLTLDKPYLANRGSTANNMDGDGKGTFSSQELIRYAYLASEPGADDPIELAVRNAADMTLPELLAIPKVSDYKIISFCPFNPNSKYTEATVQNLTTKETFKVMKGASQIVAAICGGHAKGEEAVVNFSMKGIRALGVARTFDADMKVFQLIGMLSLLDPPRHDSQDTVRACMAFGVDVKMITGDQLIIAKSMASRLGMNRNIFDGKRLDEKKSPEEMSDFVMKSGGFAQVVPEHKYRMVEILQNRGYLVGMTGDGVNDAPALKKANVGIAVHGCTDAARAAADIVLLAPGLGTIVDGIITSRKIFQRMKSYSSNIPINLVYRIASTVHFLLFFFIALLALPRFEMSDRLVILIAVLNDAATLVISVDSAKVSPKPDKWRLGQLIVLSTVLGLLLTGMSFVTYFIAQANGLTDAQISTVMYLQISSCPHFVIFSTRTHGWFWESIPSPTFLFAVIGTQIFAMLICVYGVADLGSTAV